MPSRIGDSVLETLHLVHSLWRVQQGRRTSRLEGVKYTIARLSMQPAPPPPNLNAQIFEVACGLDTRVYAVVFVSSLEDPRGVRPEEA